MKGKILLVGALPPPVGGTTISFKELVEYFDSDDNYQFFDLNRLRSKSDFLRSVWVLFLMLVRAKVWSFHVSDNAAVRFLPMFWIFSKVLRRKIVYRQFGGEFVSTYNSLLPIQKSFFRYTVLKSDVVYFQTKKMVEFFLGQMPDQNIQWLPTSRKFASENTTFMDNTDSRFHRKVLKVVFAGRLSRLKGVVELINAVRSFSSIELDLYGPVEDDEILRIVDKAGNVYYRGIVDRQQLAEVYAEAAVFALPSYHPGEGYSGAVIEALQYGVPPLVSRWNAFEEMLPQDVAFFVDPKSEKSIVSCLEEVLSNRGLLTQASLNALLYSRQFDLDVVCKKIDQDHKECAA
ncbi:glycosyltransferase family 4 protein [Neptuniibacter sp. QD48_55]|uniref:glycosyltransferase family 4 protein n=1 Tax=Neptuniibacter sp. QD48_55 TaxID=3398212 RepID=UPI0039F53363